MLLEALVNTIDKSKFMHTMESYLEDQLMFMSA